jgi:hypothetical protein
MTVLSVVLPLKCCCGSFSAISYVCALLLWPSITFWFRIINAIREICKETFYLQMSRTKKLCKTGGVCAGRWYPEWSKGAGSCKGLCVFPSCKENWSICWEGKEAIFPGTSTSSTPVQYLFTLLAASSHWYSVPHPERWLADGVLFWLQVTKDLNRIKRFSSQEALDYGLIDRIIRPRRIKPDARKQETAGVGLGWKSLKSLFPLYCSLLLCTVHCSW